MDEKELWEGIDHKYASLIKDLSSSDRSVLVDWRIVHLFHVFGGIEGTEGAHAKLHTQSLIHCLNETGNEDVAKYFEQNPGGTATPLGSVMHDKSDEDNWQFLVAIIMF